MTHDVDDTDSVDTYVVDVVDIVDVEDDSFTVIDAEKELEDEYEYEKEKENENEKEKEKEQFPELSTYDVMVIMPFVSHCFEHPLSLYEQMWIRLPFLSTTLFVFPFIWTMYTYKTTVLPIPLWLSILSVITAIVSFIFWSNPVQNRNTWVHHLDAKMARLTIFGIILYNIFGGFYAKFWFSCLIMFVFFALSNYFSTVHDFGCIWHILMHVCAHIFASLGVYFTIEANLSRCLL